MRANIRDTRNTRRESMPGRFTTSGSMVDGAAKEEDNVEEDWRDVFFGRVKSDVGRRMDAV